MYYIQCCQVPQTTQELADPEGHHPQSHQEQAQVLSRVHTSMQGPFTLHYELELQPVIEMFYFNFRCDFESSPQWVNDFGFHWPFLGHFVQLRSSTWTINSSQSWYHYLQTDWFSAETVTFKDTYTVVQPICVSPLLISCTELFFPGSLINRIYLTMKSHC